ncbi:hypothetical protein ScPMuIL_015468 [Solemya velum]
MELKVWADGIQRVVCGVGTNTSCQEVVIALAHAMGRTGRFTLMEKWRDNERPLPPSECPLSVLQKWGEYASEVQFHLIMPEKEPIKNKRKHFNSQDRYKHNFTPPLKTEPVKRSSTFSGAHSTGVQLDKRKEASIVTHKKNLQSISENGCEKHSIPSPSPKMFNNQKTPAPSDHINSNSRHTPPTEHDPAKQTCHHRQLPDVRGVTHSPKPTQEESLSVSQIKEKLKNVGLTSENCKAAEKHTKKPPVSSILSLVQNKKAPVPRKRGQSLERKKANNVDVTLPLYSIGGEPRPEVEEYDLDRNFPDVVKDSNREKYVEEYHVSSSETIHQLVPQGKELDPDPDPDPELMELLRLVTLQQGRIKTQESQIQQINSELSPLEGCENIERDMIQCEKDIQQLHEKESELDSEVTDLESRSWTSIVQREQQLEKSLKMEIHSFKSKSDKCDSDIIDLRNQIMELNSQIVEQKNELEENRVQSNHENEVTAQNVASLEKELADVQDELAKGESLCEETEKESESLEHEIEQKQNEITEIEKELVKVNMKDFSFVSLTPDNHKTSEKISGGAKITNGRFSPGFGMSRKIIASPLSKILSMSKSPNAVWV